MTVLNRPTTSVYSVRADIRTIAALTEYFTAQGYTIRSISELHRIVIESFIDILEANSILKTYNSTEKATNYLEQVGLLRTLQKKNKPNLIKQIQKETLNLEGINATQMYRRNIENVSPNGFESAKEKLEKKLEESGEILGSKLGEAKE